LAGIAPFSDSYGAIHLEVLHFAPRTGFVRLTAIIGPRPTDPCQQNPPGGREVRFRAATQSLSSLAPALPRGEGSRGYFALLIDAGCRLMGGRPEIKQPPRLVKIHSQLFTRGGGRGSSAFTRTTVRNWLERHGRSRLSIKRRPHSHPGWRKLRRNFWQDRRDRPEITLQAREIYCLKMSLPARIQDGGLVGLFCRLTDWGGQSFRGAALVRPAVSFIHRRVFFRSR